MQHQTIPPGLCQCGCGEKTKPARQSHTRDGWVKGEPLRYLAGHGNRNRVAPESRYTERDCGFTTPCWVWLRERNRDGYGRVKVGGKRYMAHRWHYERAKGAIPDGLVIDHLCRNTSCVNPDHLEPVTITENNRRGGPSKLGHDGVEQARLLLADGWTHIRVARALGVSRPAITLLANGKTWATQETTQ